MGIQQDIKQSKFRNEWQKATINIIYTNSWLEEKMRDFLGEEDLTSQQFNVLRILRGSVPQPLSTLEIRNRMLDKMSDVSRIVDRLIKKELVEKRVCLKDKRLVDVTISAKGLKLLEKLDVKNDEIDAHVKTITETEAKTLNKILDKLRGN
jgi:DNA-binding MarR family transcriptional regulator